jgi:hypothetical protein
MLNIQQPHDYNVNGQLQDAAGSYKTRDGSPSFHRTFLLESPEAKFQAYRLVQMR